MKKIILASASPRRKELLEKAGLQFEIDPSDCDEDIKSELAPEALARTNSLMKACSVVGKYSNAVIIAADTFVVFQGETMGKPGTEAEAKRMLTKLKGNAHKVITGFTVIDTDTLEALTQSVETVVHIKGLTTEEIDAYVATGEPLDKAGAYAIQGLGAALVDKIEGDFSNVVGLPVNALKKALRKFDLDDEP